MARLTEFCCPASWGSLVKESSRRLVSRIVLVVDGKSRKRWAFGLQVVDTVSVVLYSAASYEEDQAPEHWTHFSVYHQLPNAVGSA